MTDWREIGEELFAVACQQWQIFQSKNDTQSEVELLPGIILNVEPSHPDPEPDFLEAIERFHRNDRTALILYLISPQDRPLGRAERHLLAHALEQQPAAHRPANNDLRFAADLGATLYKEWRDRNTRQGVSSRGHVTQMKYECARFVSEVYYGNSIDADRVCDLMGRSGDRRDMSVGSSTELKFSQK